MYTLAYCYLYNYVCISLISKLMKSEVPNFDLNTFNHLNFASNLEA
jgi:hypothetical protein